MPLSGIATRKDLLLLKSPDSPAERTAEKRRIRKHQVLDVIRRFGPIARVEIARKALRASRLIQVRDPAQLGGHVHGGQHRDPADERAERGLATVHVQFVQAADDVEEPHREQHRGYRDGQRDFPA